jgi:hypothetical protein
MMVQGESDFSVCAWCAWCVGSISQKSKNKKCSGATKQADLFVFTPFNRTHHAHHAQRFALKRAPIGALRVFNCLSVVQNCFCLFICKYFWLWFNVTIDRISMMDLPTSSFLPLHTLHNVSNAFAITHI